MFLLFRFTVLCLFVSSQVWGCGYSGLPCPDGWKCHSPNDDEYCPDGGDTCCFDHSEDEESHLSLILGIVAGLTAVVIISLVIYNKCKSKSNQEDSQDLDNHQKQENQFHF